MSVGAARLVGEAGGVCLVQVNHQQLDGFPTKTFVLSSLGFVLSENPGVVKGTFPAWFPR